MKRNGRAIRGWMVCKGITVARIAQMANAQPAHASHTIYGNRNHRRTLKTLLDLGCPEEFLALSEKMKSEIVKQ